MLRALPCVPTQRLLARWIGRVFSAEEVGNGLDLASAGDARDGAFGGARKRVRCALKDFVGVVDADVGLLGDSG